MMGEGGTYFVVSISQDLRNDSRPFQVWTAPSAEGGSQTLGLYWRTDGRFAITSSEPGKPQGTIFESVPVSVSHQGTVIFAVLWSNAVGRLRLNATEIPTRETGGDPIHIEVTPFALSPHLSFEHPDAPAACGQWVANRRARFAAPPKLWPGRRPKTLDEQATEFFDACSNLHAAVREVVNGNRAALQIVASSLRALIFWKDDKAHDQSYNPVLYQMAAVAELPLAVYAVGRVNPKSPPREVQSARFGLIGMDVWVRQTYPTQQLVDIQEWLTWPYLVQREHGGVTLAAPRWPTGREVVAEAANALGMSHFDASSPEALDALKEMVFLEFDLFNRTMVTIAEVVLPLSSWVLTKLIERGVIADPSH